MMTEKTRLEFKFGKEQTLVTVDYIDKNGVPGSKAKYFESNYPRHFVMTKGHITGDVILEWEDAEKVTPLFVTNDKDKVEKKKEQTHGKKSKK